jgi:hypothetical protein
MRLIILAGLSLSTLALAACNSNSGQSANRAICYNFHAAAVAGSSASAATPAAASAGAATPVDDCVRRWAYSLAPSRDDAEVVSEAVVAACMSTLASWNEQTLSQGNMPPQAPSITTGQPTNPLAEHNNLAHARALFYVVQARAGRCAPPPGMRGSPQV